MKGVARFLGPASGEVLPPFPIDDDFQGTELNSFWQLYKPASIAGITVGGGFMRFPIVGGGPGPTGSFWFDEDDGGQVWQLCQGDVDLRCFVQARDAQDDGPTPTEDFKITGIAVHDPSGAPFNYVHVGLGSNTTGALQAEHKSTQNGESFFNYVEVASGSAWLRLVRIGQLFSTFHGPAEDGPWTPVGETDRAIELPLMPDILRVGPVNYSNVPGPTDILGRFSYFTARRP